MSQYWESISKLPRAARWGLAALLFVGLYFGCIERAIDSINKFNSQGDAKEMLLESFAASTEPQKRALEALTLGTRQFGDVDFPEEPSTRSVAFDRAVAKVLADQKVSNQKSRTKNAPLGAGPLTSKVGTDQRVERMVRDIEFDAPPETVVGVVAALERSPVVATVSKVQIRQIDSKDKSARLVHATVTAEAWLIGPRKG